MTIYTPKIGDIIIMNSNAGEYSCTKQGSIGIITDIDYEDDMHKYSVHFFILTGQHLLDHFGVRLDTFDFYDSFE